MATEARDTKGKAIAENGNVKKVNDHSFKVKSQSGNGVYEVKATPNGMTCTCPDFVYRGGKCKHIQATRYYLEIEKDTPQGTVTEKVHLTYKQAWDAYNTAQMVEVKLFDDLLKDLVKTIPEPEQTMGRPRLSLQETLFCAIQKVYSQLSSRRAHSLFQNATERHQIEHAPHFNAPSKLFNNPDMTPILHNLITLSALPVASIETDFSVDSTGFRTTQFNAYNGIKHGQKREHQWIKAHLCAGVKTNVVAAVAITDAYSNDSPQFGPLVKKTAEGFTINEISADMAYSSRLNLQLVANEGGKAYIPFRKNATGKAKESTLWGKMYHYFQLNRDDFMEHYHKRSNIESTNAAIKRKFGETLKSKNPTAQVNELLAKIIAYNLTVVIHEMYENGIQPEFLQLKSDDCN
ncbi:MAG TPA: IS5 family transposase [Methanothrix sp.]|jgi:transposase|nr:IS5 family transposase [Methanothrix sp.]HOV81592.1 IS5 family transposase [Methanothrix sp.]HPC89603.1 IS5 family transposase [Methanothrix sp.]HQE87410.1 IS5 family transposase [Methanothrix sp.]HQI67932.1 IS5 family transposase [Methanothrix sp.]